MNTIMYPLYEGPKLACDGCKKPFTDGQHIAIDPGIDCILCTNTACLIWHCIDTKKSIYISETRIFKTPNPTPEIDQWPEEIDSNEFE